jgi:DNA-binding response OmpR family regulator
VNSPPPFRRVLIVDDDRNVANALRHSFTTNGAEARGVFDAFTGIEAAIDWNPDLIVLDIALPGMNGWEVARRLRKAIPARLVAVSGLSDSAHARRSLAVGFDAHLVKPVGLGDIYRALGV